MIKICIAGITGRMGKAIIEESITRNFQITGAIADTSDINLGKSLKEIGFCNSSVIVMSPSALEKAVKDADIYITFTTPEAELQNIPKVVNLKKKIIMGTTGFSKEEIIKIKSITSGNVPAIFSPNFSLGINLLFKLTQLLKFLPPEYDFGLTEIHHNRKKDTPSGTARKLGDLISEIRKYSKIVYGRQGFSPRTKEELEISSLRAGGVPGIHDLIVAGPHEMIKIEHIAFSRRVFAQGALLAAEWLNNQSKARLYTLDDVFA